MASVLDKIGTYKLDEIAAAKKKIPQSEIELLAKQADPVRDFEGALRAQVEAGRYGLICEIKKASPSKGLIRDDFDPPALAKAFEAGGATCLSVLTDAPSFQGASEYLVEARAATSLPALRKDFMYDPYQVCEARAWNADCILIILAAVSDMQALELEDTARALGMSVLLEVHNEDELDRGLLLKSPLFGVNNRDLNTFETSLETTLRLSHHVPKDRLMISESGINEPADVEVLSGAGAHCFLIGESLMRQTDVEKATRHLSSLSR